MPKIILINKGDCFISISKQEGFFWKTLWDHPENKELNRKRQHPNIIKAGDRIYIPDKEIKEYTCETEKLHCFRLKGETVSFTLTLLDLGQPRANENYVLIVNGKSRNGATDENGTLNEPIPQNARTGLLLLGKNQEEILINFGHIDPIDEISGVKTRLENLGFYDGEINDELDPELITAVAEFRRSVGLPGEGDLNDEMRKALVEAHGG